MSSFHQRSLVIGAIMISVASSGLTAWLMSSGGKSDADSGENLVSLNEVQQSNKSSPPLEDTAVIEQFMKLQGQIDALDQRLAQMAKNDETTNQSSEADEGADKSVSPITQEEEIKALRQQVDLVASRYQAEEVDVAWADNVSVNIQDAFLADGIVGNSTLDNVDCRSSVCKLDVSLSGDGDLASVRGSLVEKVGEMLPYGAIQPGESENQVTIYLGSNSDTFSAPQ